MQLSMNLKLKAQRIHHLGRCKKFGSLDLILLAFT